MRLNEAGELERSTACGRVAAALGVASALLLAAALRWAHHWGPLADTIVVAWAAATLSALGASTYALLSLRGERRLARIGLGLALLSVFALVAAGVAAASGVDPAGACGGG